MERKSVRLYRKPCYKVTKELEISFPGLLLIYFERVLYIISHNLTSTIIQLSTLKNLP